MAFSDKIPFIRGKVLWTTVTPRYNNDQDFRMEVTHLNRVYQRVARDYIDTGMYQDGLGEWFFNELNTVLSGSMKKIEEGYGTVLKWESSVVDFSVELWSFYRGSQVAKGVFAAWVKTGNGMYSLENFLTGDIKQQSKKVEEIYT